LDQVTAELSNIAAAVDRVSEASDLTAELLEASRAIHKAVVLLNDWSGSSEDY
jgi:hypothetical protein